jgi:protein O-mannosyl-transferase
VGKLAERVGAAAVAVVTFVVFLPALGAGLLDWDDGIAIFENPHIRSFDWGWMFGDLAYNPRYMPLTWLDWTITYRLFGLRPWAYHLGNVAFHTANAVLLFVLITRLLRSMATRVSPWRAAAATALGTLAWSIHPLRVEPVTWATDRSYSQALFFLLVALLLHLSWVQTRRRSRYVLAVVAFAAAVLSYPIVLGAAGVLFLLDVAPLGRPLDRRTVVEKLPYVALAGGALAMTAAARLTNSDVWLPAVNLGSFGVVPRAMQAAYVWTYYAWRPLVPVGLAPVYTQLFDFRPLSAPFVASALFVVVLSVAAWTLRRRAPWLLAAWGAHLVLLVPSLGLTERPHYPNDRYDHVAGIVLAVLLAAVLLRARRAASLAALALVAGLGVLSVRQEAVWHDNVSLYVHTLETLGDDPYRVDIYGRMGELFKREHDWTRAARAWDGLLAVNPGADKARYERAVAHFNLGDWEPAAADLRLLLQTHQDAPLHELYGLTLAQQRKYDEAIVELAEAARQRPNDRTAQRNLAEVTKQRAASSR